MKADDDFFLKILVVDDETDIVDEILELLHDEGFPCQGVNNAQQALKLIDEDPDIGIIISDIRMPGMNGLEMAQRLLQAQETDRDLHLIIVTGHAGMAEAIEALKLGADDFLTKPLNSEQLLHAVRRSMEEAALRDKDRELKLRLAMEAESSSREVEALAEQLSLRNKELTKINKELLEVGQLKDEFLSMISHELNTPLNGIIGFTQLLQQMFEAEGDDKKIDLTEHIISSADRLHNHITTILNIAKAQSGSLRIDKQPFVVGDLYRNLASKYGPDAEAKDGIIKIDIADSTMSCTADTEVLTDALGCLIGNSLKFSPAGVNIILGAEKTERGIRLSVADDGLGMDVETIRTALDPLRQGDGKLTRRFEGMGLGLPLARQYVRLHDGQIDIESTPGKGTRVFIELPD